MSTIAIDQPFISGIPIDGVLTIPLLEFSNKFSLSITAPNSVFKLDVPLVAAPIIESDRFVAEFALDTSVNIILTLIGKRTNDGTKFQYGQFHLSYVITEPCPRAHFVASTFMAICGLAGKVNIPALISTELKLDLPLLEISTLLQRRQTAYRLMVIEKATGREFLLPPSYASGESDTINFVYHAIVDRSFVWHSGRMEAAIPATQEWLILFNTFNTQPINFPSEEISIDETILGQTISLGPAKIIIADAIVQNYDKVLAELAEMDGRLVSLVVQSLSGQVRYEFPCAPRLSDVPWDSKIQAFIDMESHLDAALVARYHTLAASTLEGLTQEERVAVTARPELDEKAFLD